MYGYSAAEVIGRSVSLLAMPGSVDDVPLILEAIGKGEPPKQHETIRRRKDGKPVRVSLRVSPIRDAAGTIVGSATIARDMTEHKQLQEEIEILNTDLAARAAKLEVANVELRAFNYTVSHDLRKPLTHINGYCQLIMEQCATALEPECRGFLREIYDSTLRMGQLIDTLLHFARLTHARLHRDTVDLSAMAKAIAAEYRMAEPGRTVHFCIADGVAVNGDAKLLRVVLDNLLGNAWKYTGDRQEAVIEFGMMEVAGKPTCFVRDNGPGFDMAETSLLFKPFHRLPGMEKFEGFGIGLATVQRIIQLHGGRLWAEGEAGKGATFYFTTR